MAAEKDKKNSPEPEAIEPPGGAQQAVSADDANPNHLKDFTRLVDVAARKRPQGDQT